MANSPAEHRARIAQMRIDEAERKKYRPPKDGTVKGNRAFARKSGKPRAPRKI